MEQKSFQTNKTGKLFLVATPIGNLDDITFRAVKILKKVDLIAAEDTRHSKILFSKFGITSPTISFHQHNYKQRIPNIISKLKTGINIAQISDAGTPSISDPGYKLVLSAIKNKLTVISVPGPSAGITALIASGLPDHNFTFIGFLPKKEEKQINFLKKLLKYKTTLILYESPFRILSTLKNIESVFGKKTKLVIARELTKKFETYYRGNLATIINFFYKKTPKGEYVILVKKENKEKIFSNEQLYKMVKNLVNQGLKPTEAIKKITKYTHYSRSKIYNIYNKLI